MEQEVLAFSTLAWSQALSLLVFALMCLGLTYPRILDRRQAGRYAIINGVWVLLGLILPFQMTLQGGITRSAMIALVMLVAVYFFVDKESWLEKDEST